MFCANCGQEINDADQRFCFKCGTPVGEAGAAVFIQTEPGKKKAKKMRKGIGLTSRINSLAGREGAVKLRLKDMVSDVLVHHTREEMDELFICGTSKTTPQVRDILTDWPRPWLYSRVGIAIMAAFFIMVFIWKQFGNSNVIPGLLFIGSLAMPIVVLTLLFEMNVPRNISFIDVIRVFIVGGAMSLVVTLFLFDYIPGSGSGALIPSMLTGLIEELGKVLVAAYFISRIKGKKWMLNGIVIGGAVGAGFAVFESAGYAMKLGVRFGLQRFLEVVTVPGSSIDQAIAAFNSTFYINMMDVVKIRGFLSPGGHVAWAAVTAFAVIYALDGREFSWGALLSPRFLRIFIFPVLLHGIWDTSVGRFLPDFFPSLTQYAVLIVVIWIFLLVFIDRGLNEVSDIVNAAQMNVNDNADPDNAGEKEAMNVLH